MKATITFEDGEDGQMKVSSVFESPEGMVYNASSMAHFAGLQALKHIDSMFHALPDAGNACIGLPEQIGVAAANEIPAEHPAIAAH